MAEYLIQGETLDDIADAINAKTGGSSAMTPAEMVTEIGSIQTGGGVTTQPLSVTENGTYTAPSGTAYTPVTVNVPTGGSLPSVIGKIDGGSFTLASDTVGNNHWISHNLGEMPKGIIIWTEDSDLRTSTAAVAQRYLISATIDVSEWTTGTKTNGIVPQYLFRGTSGAASTTGSPILQTQTNDYIETERFRNPAASVYYKAGIEYKWVAFA